MHWVIQGELEITTSTHLNALGYSRGIGDNDLNTSECIGLFKGIGDNDLNTSECTGLFKGIGDNDLNTECYSFTFILTLSFKFSFWVSHLATVFIFYLFISF